MYGRYMTIILAVLLWTTALLHADTVELVGTGEKLEGKIQEETEEFIILLVNKDKGRLQIARNKIKNIEYDIKTKLDKIAADDFQGFYKVGVWAFDKGLYQDALDQFEKLNGKENIPADRLKYMGRAYEQRKQLDKALSAYSDYIKSCPDDKEVADRIPALRKEVNPIGTADAAAPVKPKIVEGLESDGAWNAENWDNPAKAQPMTDKDSGNKTIALNSEGGAKDKCAVTRTGPPLNLSESKEMVFKVYFVGTAVGHVAVAFINSKNEYFESRAVKLVPNIWNAISIKVDGKDFKTEKSKWQHTESLGGSENVSRIVFQFHTQKFTAYIDEVFFKGQQPENK